MTLYYLNVMLIGEVFSHCRISVSALVFNPNIIKPNGPHLMFLYLNNTSDLICNLQHQDVTEYTSGTCQDGLKE